MKWYVYWEVGSCQYGDHASGMEEYMTSAEAYDRVGNLKHEHPIGLDVRVIHGHEMEVK